MEHLTTRAVQGAASPVSLDSVNSLRPPKAEINEELDRFYAAAEVAIDRCARPRFTVRGDPDYMPSVLQDLHYEKRLAEAPSHDKTLLHFALVQRGEGANVHRGVLEIFQPAGVDRRLGALTLAYVRRAIHSSLWRFGGGEVQLAGPIEVTNYLEWRYSTDEKTRGGRAGPGAKEAGMMRQLYDSFQVVTLASPSELPLCQGIPPVHSPPVAKEKNLIGVDIDGSDIKVAVYNRGSAVHLQKVEWNPSKERDAGELEKTLSQAIEAAIPYLDGPLHGVGVSCAGVIRKLEIVSSSILEGLRADDPAMRREGRRLLKTIRDKLERRWGKTVRWEAANDGALAALAAAEEVGEGGVLGIALGTSEAVGLVTGERSLDVQLNELSFMQIDCGVKPDGRAPSGRQEPRTGNFGAGARYLSQDGVLALLDGGGFKFPEKLAEARPRDRLKHAQELLKKGAQSQIEIACRGVGVYVGYAVAQYARHYDFGRVVLMGQVMEGAMGELILDAARRVLSKEFDWLCAARNLKIEKPRESEDPQDKEKSSYAQARAAWRLVSS